MCESITKDRDDAELVQAQVTKAADVKVVHPSDTDDYLDESSTGEALELETLKQAAQVSDLDLDEASSDTDSTTSKQPSDEEDSDDWEDLLGLYDDPASGEVSDLVDNKLISSSTSSKGLEDLGTVPDVVLEQVADRLRIIGDEMDSDIRHNRMLSRRHRGAAGLPVRGFDVIVDLFPMRSTSRKNLAVTGDLACENLTRDLVRATLRRALVAVGSAFAHALFRELVSNTVVACPVDFRRKWSAIKWTRWSIG